MAVTTRTTAVVVIALAAVAAALVPDEGSLRAEQALARRVMDSQEDGCWGDALAQMDGSCAEMTDAAKQKVRG